MAGLVLIYPLLLIRDSGLRTVDCYTSVSGDRPEAVKISSSVCANMGEDSQASMAILKFDWQSDYVLHGTTMVVVRDKEREREKREWHESIWIC